MEKIILHSPYGDEPLYQTTLNAAVQHLAAMLSPVAESFSALPATAQLTEQLLPAAQTTWDEWATRGMVYLEITPDSLMGFGFSISPGELPDMPPLSSPLACWGFAAAVAERLADFCGARVCPLYLENALNLAVGNLRMTVALKKL